eukprot:ANDGO_03255.mRNA.1 ATP-dependent helicase HRQ1
MRNAEEGLDELHNDGVMNRKHNRRRLSNNDDDDDDVDEDDVEEDAEDEKCTASAPKRKKVVLKVAAKPTKRGDEKVEQQHGVRLDRIPALILPESVDRLCKVFTTVYHSCLFCLRVKNMNSFETIRKMVMSSTTDNLVFDSVVAGQLHSVWPGCLRFQETGSLSSVAGETVVLVEFCQDSEVVDAFNTSKKAKKRVLGGLLYETRPAKFRNLCLLHIANTVYAEFLKSIKAAVDEPIARHLQKERKWHPGFEFFLKMDQLPQIPSSVFPLRDRIELLEASLRASSGSASSASHSAPSSTAASLPPRTSATTNGSSSLSIPSDGGFLLEHRPVKVGSFLEYIKKLPLYHGQIVHEHVLPAHAAQYGSAALADLMNPLLATVLPQMGIGRLYTHQEEGLKLVKSGKNVVISTSTASGKSLVFHASVISAILESSSTRAFYIFPTRALAQDQMKWLADFLERLGRCESTLGPSAEGIDSERRGVRACTFDSDTAFSARSALRQSTNIFLTNPDMIHYDILRHHAVWQVVLRNLRFIVVDEAHYYRGAFGCHIALVLRRLLRLCTVVYGNSPQIIICSATIASPVQHAATLCGVPFSAVLSDGSPRLAKTFVFWNLNTAPQPSPNPSPNARDTVQGALVPLTDGMMQVEAEEVLFGPLAEVSFLLSHLVRHHINTIAFFGSRRLAELSLRLCRDRLTNDGCSNLCSRVEVYRAGYTAEMRRSVEKRLSDGDLWGVCATNALELGIDIGEAQATMVLGFPGSVASFWQQAGRSGRRMNDDGSVNAMSLSFFIPFQDPMNQHIVRHPETILNLESALRKEQTPITATNKYILKQHAPYANLECLLSSDRPCDADFVSVAPFIPDIRILPIVSLRNIDSVRFQVFDARSSEVIESVDTFDAICRLHPGAVYLTRGQYFTVAVFDAAKHRITINPVEAPSYHTEAVDHTHCKITRLMQRQEFGDFSVQMVEMHVRRFVDYYRKRCLKTDRVLDKVKVELPDVNYDTIGLCIELNGSLFPSLRDGRDRDLNIGPAFCIVHALEHALLQFSPFVSGGDFKDVAGQGCDASTFVPLRPRICIFETTPGGSGVSEIMFRRIPDLFKLAYAAVAECACDRGCRSCVCSPSCSLHNDELDKFGCKILLSSLCQHNSWL